MTSEGSIKAFDHQSAYFDTIYNEEDIILQYKRARVRKIFLQHAAHRKNVLELNCGTGEDALFFNSHGFEVTATDGAPGMLNIAKEKAAATDIHFAHVPFSALSSFSPGKKYELLFSNFGGLNCTDDLEKILPQAMNLLEENGVAVLTIMPSVCPWEMSYIFRGKPGLAFRRWGKKSKAKIDDHFFEAWFYNVHDIRKFIKDKAEIIDVYGLCTFVPPSYMKRFPTQLKTFYKLLTFLERKFAHYWPFNRFGDYLVYVLRKK